MIRIREFDMEEDLKAVEELERNCDVDPSSSGSSKNKKKKDSVSLCVDQLGDPLCRVRHVPDHIMLVYHGTQNPKLSQEVAESGEVNKREIIVGVIRACVKTVTRGSSAVADPTCQLQPRCPPFYVRVGYILGLRVSPAHRRLWIGTKLVQMVELWCIQKGAEYAYIAADGSNTASLNLFTHRRLSYTPFRSLTILTQPVHAHPLSLPNSQTKILPVPPSLSVALYHHHFSANGSEFFPSDIHSLLSHPLTLGTFLAVHPSVEEPLSQLPPSFAVMSLWNSSQVFKMKLSGGSKIMRSVVKWTRATDRLMPWMKIPSVKDVFRPFGVYVMYGMYMKGDEGGRLMRCLCRYAHDLAMEDEEVAAVVAEVGGSDEVKEKVLHWKKFSLEEDVWCMKKLVMDDESDDWSKSMASENVIFVDPREF